MILSVVCKFAGCKQCEESRKLVCLQDLVTFFHPHKKNCPHVDTYIRRIHTHTKIIKFIEQIISPQGEIRDDASPELRRIKKEILKLENEQKTILTKVIKRYTEFTQDNIVTLRDGRMVLGIQ